MEIISCTYVDIDDIKEKLIYTRNELLRLLPEELREEFIEKSFIAGGCFYSLANNQIPKDYDFFVTDESLIVNLIQYITRVGQLKYKNGVKIGRHYGLRLIITDNAISIGDFQIITKWVGSPEEVVKQFDFKHLQHYLHKDNMETISGWGYLRDDNLYYNEERARDVVGTVIRANKFVARGFHISNKEMSKILLKLNEVGFSDEEIATLKFNDERNDFGS